MSRSHLCSAVIAGIVGIAGMASLADATTVQVNNQPFYNCTVLRDDHDGVSGNVNLYCRSVKELPRSPAWAAYPWRWRYGTWEVYITDSIHVVDGYNCYVEHLRTQVVDTYTFTCP